MRAWSKASRKILHISAQKLWAGWQLIAILTGLTEKVPPVDLVLFMWAGLFLFFIKSAISKDLLNIVTIGLGFFVQAALMALILFK